MDLSLVCAAWALYLCLAYLKKKIPTGNKMLRLLSKSGFSYLYYVFAPLLSSLCAKYLAQSMVADEIAANGATKVSILAPRDHCHPAFGQSLQ